MTARFEISNVIDRPIDKVFHFWADEHDRNHPRWDPDMELWKTSDAPIGVGTLLRRRNSRSGTPVDGTMEVVEFERNRAVGMVIHDGLAEWRARATFEATGENQTKITTVFEILGMEDSMDKSFMNSRLERSARNMKQLMESEL